jgi:excinuclease ABC subunit C
MSRVYHNKRMSLEEKARHLPASPGVYLLKDKDREVIYVGKAKNLRARVRSYLQETPDDRRRSQFLRARLADLEVIITDTEKEALLLENNLIKKYRPRYNVRLRDDKTYFHLKLTLSERFPMLLLTRRPRPGKDILFGPFASSRAVKETIELLQSLFPLRLCTTPRFQHRGRPCLNFQIKKCLGPCAGEIDEKEYQNLVQQVILFLKGKNQELLDRLREDMARASEAMEFERAARIRDRIRSIEATLERQKVESTSFLDRDVFGFFREADQVQIHILGFRQGALRLSQGFPLKRVRLSDSEVLGSFLKQYYHDRDLVPDEIILPFSADDAELMAEILSERRGKSLAILVPLRGEKRDLAEMASANAHQSFLAERERKELKARALEELKSRLRLKDIPHWIEAYDISNLGPAAAVASMVKFQHGEPEKSGYRRYRIKAVTGQDDYAMMKEVLTRRFRRALDEGAALPDLIVLDGGKGQLNIALSVLKDFGIKGPDLIALAKEREQGKPLSSHLEKKGERVYIPRIKDPVYLRPHTPALHLLVEIRDEAHRFANEYQKRLARKKLTRSALLDLPGIGKKKSNILLRHFKSMAKLKESTPEQIAALPGISKKDADTIYKSLHPDNKSRK